MTDKKQVVTFSEDGKRMNVSGLISGVSDTFELVDRVPRGYSIWCIGDNMPDGYLPLCKLAAIQPFPGGRNIDPNSLKAIKCEGAQTILAAAVLGPGTIDKMEKFIKKHEANGKRLHAVEKVKKALPFMRKIEWE